MRRDSIVGNQQRNAQKPPTIGGFFVEIGASSAKMPNKRGCAMDKTMNNPYSKKTLKALAQILRVHRALIWVNPVTNAIDVKRVFDRAEGVQQPPTGVSFA